MAGPDARLGPYQRIGATSQGGGHPMHHRTRPHSAVRISPSSSPYRDSRRLSVLRRAMGLGTYCLLAATFAAIAVNPTPAAAGEGLYLTWDNCFQGAGATSNHDFA